MVGYKDFITFQLTLACKRPPSMLSDLPMAKRLPMDDSWRAVKAELQTLLRALAKSFWNCG